MEITINQLKINYEVAGEGKPLLLLHGWGACIASFAPVIHALSTAGRKVYAIDFPGFGQSDEPKVPMTVKDYAELVASLIEQLDIAGTDIICHSFGGRVSIVLAATHPHLVEKIVFTDAAGLRKKRTLRYYCRVYTYKLMKRSARNRFLSGFFRLLGIDVKARVANACSEDYKQLKSDVMRKTFINTVNEDLRRYLPLIQAPSLMVYGENDQDTPVYFGEIMAKEIPDGGLVVLKDAGHFSYLDQFAQYIKIVKVFLEVSE